MTSFFTLLVQQFILAWYGLATAMAPAAQAAIGTDSYVAGSQAVFILQWIAAGATVALVWGIVSLNVKIGDLNRKIAVAETVAPTEPSAGGLLQNRWNEIMHHIDSINEGEWKYAVIEADKLVDDQLKDRFAGETMGERLMNIDKTQLLSIDGLWEAHKVRNRLAHDVNYFLRHAEAVRAIRLFEATLKELGAIQ